MSKKLIVPATNRLTEALGNHARHQAKTPPHTGVTKPLVAASFLSWIDPPIGVDMSLIDSAHPNYKISVMTVFVSSTAQVLVLPYAEAVLWSPFSPPILLQSQLTSTLPNDNTASPLYYETMFVQQASPGVLPIRSRVFLTPQSAQFTNNGVAAPSTAVAVGGMIQVTGVVNSSNQPVTAVYYDHFTVDDGYLPADLYLQQPSLSSS
jgi:hypothetical protein